MQTSRCRKEQHPSAFSLIELLVVIGVIGILAAMILPTIRGSRGQEKIARARTEITALVQEIYAYYGAHNRYPTANTTTTDLTEGGSALGAALGAGTWTTNNSDVMAILMDREKDSLGNPTSNAGHVRNPEKIPLIYPPMASSVDEPGVGPDLVYRDPWGNPYVISLDLNYDGRCRDAFYGRRSVSQQSGAVGFNGLANPIDAGGMGDNFSFNGAVMVWSLGPDKRADANTNANAGFNRDNIMSWK